MRRPAARAILAANAGTGRRYVHIRLSADIPDHDLAGVLPALARNRMQSEPPHVDVAVHKPWQRAVSVWDVVVGHHCCLSEQLMTNRFTLALNSTSTALVLRSSQDFSGFS